MTQAQKTVVLKLRSAGKSYTEISRITSLPTGTIKAFCSRNPANNYLDTPQCCAYCNRELTKSSPHKSKRFCSDQCRYRWWGRNRNKKAIQGAVRECIQCKEKYASYNTASKFCSHPCYVAHRFGKGNRQP